MDFDELQARLGPMDDGLYSGTGSKLLIIRGGGDEQIAPGRGGSQQETAKTIEMMRQTWRMGTE